MPPSVQYILPAQRIDVRRVRPLLIAATIAMALAIGDMLDSGANGDGYRHAPRRRDTTTLGASTTSVGPGPAVGTPGQSGTPRWPLLGGSAGASTADPCPASPAGLTGLTTVPVLVPTTEPTTSMPSGVRTSPGWYSESDRGPHDVPPSALGPGPCLAMVADVTDSDADGLGDAFETWSSHTDPHRADSDGDGVPDGAEDPDGDGLSTAAEARLGLDPLRADSDGDGVDDWHGDEDGNGRVDGRDQDDRPVPSVLRPSLGRAFDDVPESYRDGCHSGTLEVAMHPCAFGGRSGSSTIVLYGDSRAAQWLPALLPNAAAHGWRIVELTKSACPAADVRFRPERFPGAAATCRVWRHHALRWLSSHPPDVILMSSADTYRLIDRQGRVLTGSSRESLWRRGLARTLRVLARGSRVIVLGDTPTMRVDVPRCLARHRRHIAACGTRRGTALHPAHDDSERAVATALGATFASLSSKVCSYDPCPVIEGHVLMWRDGYHLTATYARTLARSIYQVVAPYLPARATG